MMYLYKKDGFSLIELMVVTALSLFVIMGAYDVYISQNRAYTVQGQVTEIQQNARVAMDLMTREIRMAGCDPTEVGIIDIVTANARRNSIRILSDLNGDGDIGDQDEDITFAFANNEITRTDATGGGARRIAENIVRLRFMYGLDVNGDGVITQNGASADDDEWVFNHTGDSIANTIAKFGGVGTINDFLDLIRITIIVRSDREDLNLINGCDVNGNCCDGCGGFRLRTLNSFVRPRNLRL